MDLLEIFGSDMFRVVFERYIYPIILSDDPKEENEDIILGIDQAYLQLVCPDLWKEFMEELKESKPRISQELKEKFDVAKAELEKLKNNIREKMRREEIKDKKRDKNK